MKGYSESQKNKINLIYIAGNVHSGSTLLEMLLGSFDEAWGLGEVYAIPWELRGGKESYECGKHPLFCPFWGKIKKEAGSILNPEGYLSLFREGLGREKMLRIKEMFLISFSCKPPKRKLSDFCRVNYEFFRIAKEKAENIAGHKLYYLVDLSKDPYRLFWLMFCKNINVKIIHLKKDPRAFVYSMTKDKKDFYLG